MVAFFQDLDLRDVTSFYTELTGEVFFWYAFIISYILELSAYDIMTSTAASTPTPISVSTSQAW